MVKTMKHETHTVWKENMQFKTDLPGGEIIFDSSAEFGGTDSGVRPKATMLGALAGCTGMDVISILKKMKVKLNDFRVEVNGTLTDEHPKIYQAVEVHYYFSGEALDAQKIEKAVDLSINRYCGVYEMFRSFAKMTYTINYE